MDVQRAFLSRLFTDGDLTDAIDANIKASLFEDEYGEIFTWSIEHYRKFGATPRSDAVGLHFPHFNFCDAPDALEFYCRAVINRHVYTLVSDAMVKAEKLLRTSADPMEAINAYREAVLAAEDAAAEEDTTLWVEDAPQRLEDYEERKRLEKIVNGVPSSFPTLDELTCGWQPGYLIYIVANTKVGKSWLLCKMLHHAWSEGHTPLMISKEMTKAQIARRFDSIDSNLPPQKLRRGQLDDDEEKRWRDRIEETREGFDDIPILYIPRGGVTQVVAKAHRYKGTKIVGIDGAYLLEDDRGERQDWLRLSNITKDLADAAKRMGVPFVVTLQLNDDDKLARSRAMLQDADVVIKMSRTEDDEHLKQMWLEVTYIREGSKGKPIKLLWDLDNNKMQEPKDEDASAHTDLADIDAQQKLTTAFIDF